MPQDGPSGEIAIAPLAPTQRLVALAPAHLRDARDGGPPKLSTALRLGWRAGELRVRFDCRHRGIVATLREDNADLWKEDVVEAFLAWDDPPTRYLELEVNPLGAKFSARVESPNLSREGMTVEKISIPGWEAKVRVRERAWSAVLSIPLSRTGPVTALDPLSRSLTAIPSATTASNERVQESRAALPVRPTEIFRANFFRIDRTSGEFSALFPTLADPPDFHVPGRFGRFQLKNEV